jgi:hypothetical protein
MSARRHFPPLPILLAKPRPIPPQQLATPPDLIRNHPAGILRVARRMRTRRNLPALLHQLPRPVLPNRPPALPSLVVALVVILLAAPRHEVRPAPVVHPNPVLVKIPRVPLLASGPASLLHQLHSAPCIHLTKVLPAVIRSAVQRLLRPARASRMFQMLRMFWPLVRLCHKLRPASVIHPNPAPIEPPGNALLARGVAVLPDQIHIPLRVCLAVVPSAVVRRAAHNRFAPAVLPRALKLHPEVRTTSVIHPDSVFVIAPRISLPALRAARLFFQCHACSRIRRAITPPPVIRRAGNLSPATRMVLPLRCSRQPAHHSTQHNQHFQNSHIDLRLSFR